MQVSFSFQTSNSRTLAEHESDMIMAHMKEHHLDFRLSTELDEIIGDFNTYRQDVPINDDITCVVGRVTA